MSEIILHSRLTPRKIAPDIVCRERLFRILDENLDKSLILVSATAGYGKTTLVNDYLLRRGKKFCWLYTAEDCNTFFKFLSYIVYSLQKLNEKFGTHTLLFIGKEQKSSIELKQSVIQDGVLVLLNEIYNTFTEDIYFVIDDLHNLENEEQPEWSADFFNILFENLPNSLHLIITTRQEPKFNITFLSAKRRVCRLGSGDLTFSQAEINELLEEVYHIHTEDTEVLSTKLKGWITGIHLALQAFGKDFTMLKLSRNQLPDEIFNYFATDIFDKLGEDVKELLITASLLENFNAEICNSILSINNSSEIIRNLKRKNIFIEETISGNADSLSPERIYNIQELLKVFLIKKLYETKSTEETGKLIISIAEYYLKTSQPYFAIKYFLIAKSFEKAIPLILDSYENFFSKGSFEILWNWVSEIPDDLIAQNDLLTYYTAQLHYHYFLNSEKTISICDALIPIYSDTKNNEMLVRTYLLKSESLHLLGKLDELIDTLQLSLKMKSSEENRAKTLLTLAKAYYRIGFEKYEEAINILNESLEICNNLSRKGLKKDILQYLGFIYSDKGEILKALYNKERALEVEEDSYKDFFLLLTLPIDYAAIGQYDKARKSIEKAEEIFNSHPSQTFKRRLMRVKAYFCFDCGDFEESIRLINQLIEMDNSLNISSYMFSYYLWTADAFRYLNRIPDAKAAFDLSEKYISTNYDRLAQNYLISLSQKNIRIDVSVFEGINAYKDCNESNNQSVLKVQAQFHLADYYLKAGMTDAATKELKESLKVFSEKGYVNFLECELFVNRAIFDFAIENKIEKKFVKSLIENARHKLSYHWLSDDCKKRLTEEIRTLTDIKLQTFGKVKFYLRGNEIPDEKWTRKKSKILLVHLLTRPEIILNKDKIVDLFFDDASLESVDALFHNTMSSIRTALKVEPFPGFEYPDEMKKSKSKKFELSPQFLIYEDKNLGLNKDYFYESDNVLFDQLYNKAKSASVSNSEKLTALKEAVELYKGEFLPGHYENWVEEMRTNYSNMFRKICEELIGILKKKGRHEEVSYYAEKLFSHDNLDDSAHINIIESQVNLGNLDSAKEKYARMLKIYDKELGEKPEKSTLELINGLLNN